jgi:hypothetical protein
VEEMMRQVSIKVICGTVVATFLCTACHADGLTPDQVRELLLENNHHLVRAMEKNTESLDRTMRENTESLDRTMRENTILLHKAMKENTEFLDKTISEGTNRIVAAISENSKNLTEAIDRLGTHYQGQLPEPSAPIIVRKTVRHVYVHRYVPCCRVIWEEYPCCPW